MGGNCETLQGFMGSITTLLLFVVMFNTSGNGDWIFWEIKLNSLNVDALLPHATRLSASWVSSMLNTPVPVFRG